MDLEESKIIELKNLIKKSKKIVFFGGAGVSTESGILDFRSKDFINCINGELINNWGNFVNRTLSFVKSKFDGKIHKTYVNDEIETRIINTFNNTSNYIEKGKISNALREILDLVGFFQ